MCGVVGMLDENFWKWAFYNDNLPMSSLSSDVCVRGCSTLTFEVVPDVADDLLKLVIMPNARVLRDIKARNVVKASEVLRRAYLYVARNETLSPQVRHQAQLQLNTFGKYTRPTTVKNRCTESGRGRGIISEFGLCRYQFRLKALKLELPGVRKASW